MGTIKIVDHKGKEHFLKNVLSWGYANKEFLIGVQLNTIIPHTLRYKVEKITSKVKVISVHIGDIEKLYIV